MSNNRDEKIKEFIEKIKNKGILTGSRAFGFENENSDWDYIVHVDWYESSLNFLNSVDIQIGRYPDYVSEACGKGFYFIYEGTTYNLICLSRDLLKYWKWALRLMQELSEKHKDKLSDKNKRKKFYKDIVDSFIELYK